MPYLVSQIYDIVNDSVKDALGKNATLTEIDTSDIVSLGKLIEEYDAYEGFYNSLVNRIVKTVYFVRAYKGRERNVLRDEHEYGAFIQKVYYKLPEATENAEWNIPQVISEATVYGQASPYDVEGTISVTAKIFGGQGTWSIEFIRPVSQLKTAFLDESGMMTFIDGIYLEAQNSMELEIERLVALAVNTSIASSLDGGKVRNLLAEYNEAHSDDTLTVKQALESADFLKYASMEIGRTIENMETMSTVFNKNGYETFTNRENLVVEMLTQFAKATDMYLQADTFHNELTSLPNYEKIPFWQGSGKNFEFDVCSAIKISNDDLENDIEQSGIICFLHDTENVAAYFGEMRTWEMLNPRSNVMIHGKTARKGYGVDDNANAIVFYMGVAGTVEVPTGDHFTATLNTTSVYRGNAIVLTLDVDEGYTATVKVGDETITEGEDGTYTYVPTSDESIEFTVTTASSNKKK